MKKEIINSSRSEAARRRAYSCNASILNQNSKINKRKTSRQSSEDLPQIASPSSASLNSFFINPQTPTKLPFPTPIVQLADWELRTIGAVAEASKLAGFFEENTFQVVGEMTNLIEALNLAELYIKKTIKFCKHFEAFRELPQDDQLLLLKDFFTELMLIRICYVFVPEKDAFVVIQVIFNDFKIKFNKNTFLFKNSG